MDHVYSYIVESILIPIVTTSTQSLTSKMGENLSSMTEKLYQIIRKKIVNNEVTKQTWEKFESNPEKYKTELEDTIATLYDNDPESKETIFKLSSEISGLLVTTNMENLQATETITGIESKRSMGNLCANIKNSRANVIVGVKLD